MTCLRLWSRRPSVSGQSSLEGSRSSSTSASCAREARAALRGQEELIALAAEPDLAVGADRQVALLDLVRIGPLEVGRLSHEELALDLHLDTVDCDANPTGGLAGKRAEIADYHDLPLTL